MYDDGIYNALQVAALSKVLPDNLSSVSPFLFRMYGMYSNCFFNWRKEQKDKLNRTTLRSRTWQWWRYVV